MEYVIGALILWVVPVFVAAAIGKPKMRTGWLYGLFLGWIGVIVIALLPTSGHAMRKCPYCAESVRREALVCPHCQRDLAAHPPEPLPSHRSGRLTRHT